MNDDITSRANDGASNRPPITIVRTSEGLRLRARSGGLVTALHPPVYRISRLVDRLDQYRRITSARTNLFSIWRHLPYGMVMRFSGRARWPVLILVAAILVASVVAIVVWRTAELFAAEMDLSSEDVPPTASCLASLLTDNASAEAGDMVFLKDVKVRPGPQPQLFIAVGAKGGRLLVRWGARTPQAGRPTPPIVDIKGTIHQMPTPRILHREWLLSRKEIELLGQQSIYVAAESVKQQD